jgi:hypothetical protein
MTIGVLASSTTGRGLHTAYPETRSKTPPDAPICLKRLLEGFIPGQPALGLQINPLIA